MKWKNAQKDKLPEHSQTVLISVNGVYHLSTFDATEGIFRLRDRPSASFNPQQHVIYWTDLEGN